MVKRVVLVHGWEGYPENNWFPWLKKELEDRGFEVIVPAMPNAEHPRIEPWISKIKEVVGDVDKDTYFVGHSIGNQAIMRYLEKMGKKVGGFISVAGFFNLPNLETEEEKEIAKPWLELPINTNKIKKNVGKIVSIFSDDDPDVPLSDKELFKKKLGAKIIVEKKKGHFSEDVGVTELQIVLNELLELAK